MAKREDDIQQVWSDYHAGSLSEGEAVARIVQRKTSEDKAREYLRSSGDGS